MMLTRAGVALCLLSVSLALSPALSPLVWKGGSTYIGGNVYDGLITRAQMYKDDVFLSIPRIKPGIQWTLLRARVKDPSHLEPYPPRVLQTQGDCHSLQSVVDIFLDPTALLWALDTGTTQVMQPQPPVKCPPKILVYDVQTGKEDREINLSGLVSPESRLQFIIADYSAEGDPYVYVSDAGTGNIIVYDVNGEKGVRVPLPPAAIPVNKDVLYISLVRRPSGDNFLYFTYRSSDVLFCISAKHLQAELSSARAWQVGKKPGMLVFLGTDDWEAEYIRYDNKTEVYKWNTATPFSESNFRLVDKGKAGLVPTHALTDYKRGVMRLLESNLISYLRNGTEQEEANNVLKVMQLEP